MNHSVELRTLDAVSVQAEELKQNENWLNFQLIAGCMTIMIMIVGISGNLLTVIALLKNKRIRNVTSTFIIGLCIADCIFCVIVLPFNALRFMTGSGIKDDILCMLVPFVQYGNVGLSLLFITMITINRYIMIAHYHIHNRVYTNWSVTFMVLFCILFSFGMQVPTLFGIWGEYKYNEKLRSCTVEPDKYGRSSKSALMIIAFVIPCIFIICCYAKIFAVVHSSEKRMAKHANRNNQNGGEKVEDVNKRKRNEWRITKMVLVIFISFFICYLPLTIVKVFDADIRFYELHLVSYVLLYMSACINPIIYVIMNKQYRKAYKTILCCQPSSIFSRISSDRPRGEVESKTVASQLSISLVQMNSTYHQLSPQ